MTPTAEHVTDEEAQRMAEWAAKWGFSGPVLHAGPTILALREQIVALRELVLLMFGTETVDLEHQQFIYRSGPQDWDAEPMTDAQHALLLDVLEASE